MAVTHSPSPPSEEQATASPAPPMSPVQSRLRWMEIATRLLLMASLGIFAWAAISVFIRPVARHLIEEPKYAGAPFDEDSHARAPVDFYQHDDATDEDDDVPLPPLRTRQTPPHPERATHEPDDDEKSAGKVELVDGTARHDAKLYGQPSERAAEVGEVHTGESVFVMKQATDWVLVLRGEGAMLGWMRRDNLKTP